MKTTDNAQLSEVEKKINEIQNKQNTAELRLRQALARLDSMSNEICLETNFIGVVKLESLKTALSQLSTNTANHFEAHYEGINSLSQHLNDVLNLIQMISVIETDLYHLLEENSSATYDNLENLTLSFADNNSRSFQQIKGAIERTIILRERLNGLKKEIEELTRTTYTRFNNLTDNILKIENNEKQIKRQLYLAYAIGMVSLIVAVVSVFIR